MKKMGILMGTMTTKKSLSLFIGFLILFVLFQNCSGFQNQTFPNSESSTNDVNNSLNRPEANGGGYTGKLTITAPSSVDPDSTYLVTISGGSAPYKISSPQGDIEIVKMNGHLFELRNNFSATVQSFQINVVDSEGASAQVTIDIVATDNVFNFSDANAVYVDASSYLIFDANMHKIIAFDKNGIPLNMLSPAGNLLQEFVSDVVYIDKDSSGNTYVLDPEDSKIHSYNSKFELIKSVDLSPYSQISSPVSMELHQDQLFVVSSGNNSIQRFSLSGQHLGALSLSGTSFQKISSVAFDSARGLTYVADKGAARIKVFKNGSWIQTISSVRFPGGNNHSLIGPATLNIGKGGEVFFSDYLFREGKYAGRQSGILGEQWTLRMDYQQGSNPTGIKLHERELSSYSSHTNCLSLQGSRVHFCNEARNIRIVNYAGNSIETLHPRLGGYNTGVSEPRHMAIDSEGGFYTTSDYQFVVGIESDQTIKYRVGGHGTDTYQFKALSGIEVVGDRLYVASEGLGLVKVFDKDSFDYLFEFRLEKDNGSSVGPKVITASKDFLFIGSENDGVFIYTFEGGKVRHVPTMKDENGSQVPLSIRDMDATSNGVLYITGFNNRIIRYNSNNNNVDGILFLSHNETSNLTVTEDDILYTNERNSIVYYKASTWEKLGSFGTSGMLPGSFNEISGLKADKNFVYICDLYNQRIQKISINLFRDK